MPQLDFPSSPTPGQVYGAPNGVTYTFDTSLGPVGVWIATPTPALTVTGGSITGTGSVGATLTYVPGVASGGLAPYSYSYQWEADGLPILGATGLNYVVQSGDAGKTLTVIITATDGATPPDSASATSTPLAITPALSIISAGSISGTPQIGATLTYAVGSATGGTGAITLTWVWRKASDNSQLQAGGSTYIIAAGLAGQRVYVELTATDSATPTPATVSANTANYPTAPATIAKAPFPTAVWNPAPPNGLDTIPGLISGLYNGTSTTITPSGCIEVSIDNSNWVAAPSTLTIAPSGVDTLYARWSISSLCGGAPSDTTITGSLEDGTYEASYSVIVQRQPSSFSFTPVLNAPLLTVEESTVANISGINTTAYVTYGPGTSAGITGSLEARIAGGAWTPLPAAGAFGTGLQIQNGQTLEVRFNTGLTLSATNTAEIYVGDGNTAKYTQASFVVTNTSSSVVPGLTLSPASPNAAPFSVSIPAESLEGTASSVGGWPIITETLVTTNILTNINSTSFTAGGTINNGESLGIAWDPTYIAGIADGGSATGDFTAGPYTNTFGYTVDKNPTFSLPGDSGTNAANALVNTGTFTPADYNSPIALTYTAGANTMTNVQASIGGGALVNVPTSGTTLIVNPGQSVRIFANVGAAPGAGSTAYSITVNLGVASQTWTQSVPAPTPRVTTPSITAPSNGSTLNPNLNSPAGIPVTASAFSSSDGAGTNHASSDWQMATDSGFSSVVFSSIGSTINLTSWFIPKANLTASTTYYLRVRYTSGTDPGGTGVAVTSSYSPTVSFSTNNFPPDPGTALGGGYFVGQYNDGGTCYNLIAAPRPGGQAACFWGPSPQTEPAVFDGTVYGKPASDAGNSGTYPVFLFTRALTCGGFTDWYTPASCELQLFYTSGFQTMAPFGQNNDTALSYWSSTQFNSNSAYSASGAGSVLPNSKNNSFISRGVRRFPA